MVKFKQSTILVTGGSGLLGTALKKIMPDALYPTHKEFDITRKNSMIEYFRNREWPDIDIVFHGAAFTSPPKIDKYPWKAIATNILGTINIIELCMFNEAKLIYMSTDYVFKGWYGNYTEWDDLNPVNKYAWSKLGGECAVRLYDNSLIIRTSFGPDKFPYDKAFIDQWTSRENVTVIAKKIVKLIKSDLTGIVHIGGDRKTVYEYAKQSRTDVGKLRRNEVDFIIPKDTSLNCNKYNTLIGRNNEQRKKR